MPDGDLKKRQARLDAFVSEELYAQAAISDQLDRKPEVVAALEIARRSTLARAYVAKLRAGLSAATDAEVQDFYDKHPELFSQRRIYRLQEIAIVAAGTRVDEIKNAFKALGTFNDRANWLKNEQIPFKVGVTVKPADELPADLVRAMLQMKDGSSFYLPSERGFTTVQITGIEESPLTKLQATPHIQRFLLNQRLAGLLAQETERLRKASKIQYFAPYEEKAKPPST